MLCIATAAVAPLMAAIITTAPTRFFFHIFSAHRIVPAIVAAFRPNIEPLLEVNGAAAALASRAPAFSASDVLYTSQACTAPSVA